MRVRDLEENKPLGGMKVLLNGRWVELRSVFRTTSGVGMWITAEDGTVWPEYTENLEDFLDLEVEEAGE